MRKALRESASNARALVSKLGRASTSSVPDRKLKFRTHVPSTIPVNCYPVMLIGNIADHAGSQVDFIGTHPNSIMPLMESVNKFQALVVDSPSLNGVWAGSVSGWAGWKSDIIYEVCRLFRAEQIPVYLVKPQIETTAFKRWDSLSSATFPGFYSQAEESGNKNTALWNYLSRLEDRV